MIDYEYIPTERTTISPNQIQNGFVFAPRYNQRNASGGMKRDASSVFMPRAREFSEFYRFDTPVLYFDNDSNNDGVSDSGHTGLRRSEIIQAIDDIAGSINVVAYFGHGLGDRLPSAGFRPTQRHLLAQAIARKAEGFTVVILYACQAGKPGGFARALWTDLMNCGVRSVVFGHETSGHATANPYKRRYPGGRYVIDPGSRLWDVWRYALRNTDLWMRYPFMEPHILRSVLESRFPSETAIGRQTRNTTRGRTPGAIGCGGG